MRTQTIEAPPSTCAAAGASVGAVTSVGVQRWRDSRIDAGLDWAAEEVPVSLEYNGIAHAVMLATPLDLEDLAIGFSLTEGVVADRREILDIVVTEWPHGIRLAIEITARRHFALKERRRSLAGRTGCGLCGIESLDHVVRAVAPVAAGSPLRAARLAGALAAMEDAQPLRAISGATHAAAWMTPDGQLIWLREDVGRHNALDKMIGAMTQIGVDPGSGAALLTSRASFEMVQKAAAAGIAIVVAISAPTGLAIRRARELNVTLVGFARAGRHVAYTHAWRLHGPCGTGGNP